MKVAKHIPEEDVDVSGGKLRLRGLTGKERDAFEASMVEGKGKKARVNLNNMRAKLVAKCVIVPETGQRMFNELEVSELGDVNAADLDVLFKAAQRLSGLSDDDVDELTKNSESDQSDDSGSN